MNQRQELEFSTGSARIVVDLAAGARIAELAVGNASLLVGRGENPLKWGCYPMAPWAGRVRNGRFAFAGIEHELPLGMPPHAIHGTTWNRPWQHEGGARFSCALGPDWPWPGRAFQEFSLEEDSLTLRLEVRSEGEPFPATLGWHPWFRRQLDVGAPAELSFEAGAMYERDAAGIPSGRLVPVPEPPWDDCFVRVERPPEIHWPGALALRIESSADHWVVYSEPEDAICVEPMTGPPNALNDGAQIVDPERPLIATARLSWREP